MGKYAYIKLSIILYHKQASLSIGFMKFLKKYFLESLIAIKKGSFNVKLPFVV